MEKLEERMTRNTIKKEQEEREVEKQEKERQIGEVGKHSKSNISMLQQSRLEESVAYGLLIKAAHLKISPIGK